MDVMPRGIRSCGGAEGGSPSESAMRRQVSCVHGVASLGELGDYSCYQRYLKFESRISVNR